jgi:hypothetical protein
VCQNLDIEYLWIDALCILLGKDGQEEWRQEAANMADVYFVTLFAASCSNTHPTFLNHKGIFTRNPKVLVRSSSGAPLIMARRKLTCGLHASYYSLSDLDPLEQRA